MLIFKIQLIIVLISKILNGEIEIKQYDIDSHVSDIIWCGLSKETVFVITELNSLYQSDNKGLSWKKLNDILINTGKNELSENENEVGKVSRMIHSPVDKNLVILMGTHGVNWITEDCGRKIYALNHGRNIKEFIFHPTVRNWGLASAFTLCDDFKGGEPCKIYKELYITTDLGKNWDILAAYVTQFGWGIYDESTIQAGIPKERILMTYEPRGKGDQKNIGWNYKIDFVYSDDFFKSKYVGAHKGNKFMLTKDFLFVAQVIDQATQEVMLLISNSKEKRYILSPIETNTKRFREHSYTFLDTTEGSVLLHINHFGEYSNYGHVYISDADGLRYSLSLKYNIHSSNGQCDFEKINSLEGLYISNIIDDEYMKNAEQEMEEESIENSSMNKPKNIKNAYIDFIITKMSYNKGGSWHRLRAPERDSTGKKYECEGQCFLNLHGLSSDFPPFYSVDSAVGVIVANGNVGHHLSHDNSEVNTFLSRDGGITWMEIKKGSHIYEVGDHGGLILLADNKNPTNTLYYSWDEGLSFQDLKISDEKLHITNVIIEPTSTSQHFVVYGLTTKKGVKKGVLIGLDFTGLHEPQCRNPDSPDTQGSDYEKWTPNDGRAGHDCLLGRKIIYVRRKQEVQCFNGLQFERKTIVENCPCTEEDFECDVGYTRIGGDQICTKINPSKEEINKPPEVCKGYYTISKGYRRIPGDSCIDGVKYDPILIPCPNSGLLSYLTSISICILIMAVILLIYYTFNLDFFKNISDTFSNYKNIKEYVNIGNIEEETNDNRLFDIDEMEVDLKSNKEDKKKSKKRNDLKLEENNKNFELI